MKHWTFALAAITTGIVAAGHGALTVRATFTGERSEHTWALEELNRELPADWAPHDFLVLEFKASSSQRFDLGIDTKAGRFFKRIGPFAGVWVRASIPLRFYREPPSTGIRPANPGLAQKCRVSIWPIFARLANTGVSTSSMGATGSSSGWIQGCSVAI